MSFFKIIFFTLAILAYLSGWNYSAAENSSENAGFDPAPESSRQKKLKDIVVLEEGKYKFGDDLYYAPDIELAFFQAAFSELRVGNGFFKSVKYPKGMLDEIIEHMSAGDVRPYIDPEDHRPFVDVEYIESHINGIPKYNVLNKWNKKLISVSFVSQNSEHFDSEAEYFTSVKSTLIEAINAINENTDLDLSYDEGLGKKADVVIVLGWVWPKNIEGLGRNTRDWEYSLYGKVDYAPKAEFGVNGFFLPNERNEIVKSFCYLNLFNKDKSSNFLLEKQAHVKECLIRSLGLPDAIEKPSNSELKSSALLAVNDLEGKQQYERAMGRTIGYSKFDLILLRSLYCPHRLAGDDYYASQFKGYKAACAYDVLDFSKSAQ